MKPRRCAGLVLGSLAAATVLVACSRDLTAPAARAVAGPARSAAAGGADAGEAPGSPTEPTDSAAPGYGNEPVGGICHLSFEYDPATGTETVVSDCPDDDWEDLLQPGYPGPAGEDPDTTSTSVGL